MTSIYDWSPTASSNASVGSINWAEGQAPSTINDSSRYEMADVAKYLDSVGGAKTSTGTDVVLLTSGLGLSAFAQGMMFGFKAGGTNTGTITLNIDDIGAKAVKKFYDADLVAGDITVNGVYVVAYDSTADNFQIISPVSNAPITSIVSDLTPVLGGPLDLNEQPIGDGTRELLTFTEDASAVNHLNIENQATGSGPTLRAAGDDDDVDIVVQSKGDAVIKLDNLVQFSVGNDVISAGTLPLIKGGTFIDVTGSVTIDNFAPTGIGSLICIQFDAALTLTHSADLFLPGAVDIKCEPGDIALFYEYAAGDYRCISYQVQNNPPSGGGDKSVINEVEFGTTTIAGLGGERYYFKIWSGAGGGGGSRENYYGWAAPNQASRAVLEVTLVADNAITYIVGPGGAGGAAAGIFGGQGGNGAAGGTSSISIDGEVVVECTGTQGGRGYLTTAPTAIVGTATVNTDAARWTVTRSVLETSAIFYGSISWSEREQYPGLSSGQTRRVGTGGLGVLGVYGGSAGLIGSYGYIGIHKI